MPAVLDHFGVARAARTRARSSEHERRAESSRRACAGGGSSTSACWTAMRPCPARAVRPRGPARPRLRGRRAPDRPRARRSPSRSWSPRSAARSTSSGHERVLDVGTGSGYQAAVLAELAAEVVTIERVPELAEQARRALAEAGLRTGRGARRRRHARRSRARAVRRDRGRRRRAVGARGALRASSLRGAASSCRSGAGVTSSWRS